MGASRNVRNSIKKPRRKTAPRFSANHGDKILGLYERVILPRLTRWVMNAKNMHRQRAKCLAGARGSVLEIGFGNGLNLRHYPPEVEKVTGIDPSMASERLARKEIAACSFPVELHTGSAEALPFADASFDTVSITWTLCTIPDPHKALREMARILRPSGRLHFVEHGISPDPGVAKWQLRLNPINKFVAGGCHLTRDIGRLITGAGFVLQELENYYIKGPKTHTYLYRGVATAAGARGG